jgi:hypothetical protein
MLSNKPSGSLSEMFLVEGFKFGYGFNFAHKCSFLSGAYCGLKLYESLYNRSARYKLYATICHYYSSQHMITRLILAMLLISQNQQWLAKKNLFGLKSIDGMISSLFRSFPASQSKPVTCFQSIIYAYYHHIHSDQAVTKRGIRASLPEILV